MLISVQNKNAGFTLIEMALVIMIIGVLVGAFSQFAKVYFAQKILEEQDKKMETVLSSFVDFTRDNSFPDPDGAGPLTAFVDPNSHFPCPANPALGPGAVNFGVESRDAAGNCLVAGGIVSTGGAAPVFIGAIPSVTLGISSDNMLDTYGNQYTYAVSQSVTTLNIMAGGNNPPGDITINKYTAAGALDPTPTTNVQYTIIGHGSNGLGAYTSSGVLIACAGASRDIENCDNDTDFVDGALQFAIAPGLAQEFDDTTLYSLAGINDDNEFWELSAADATEIVNSNTGFVGINTADPTAQLDVTGDVLITGDSLTAQTEMNVGNVLLFNDNSDGIVPYILLNRLGNWSGELGIQLIMDGDGDVSNDMLMDTAGDDIAFMVSAQRNPGDPTIDTIIMWSDGRANFQSVGAAKGAPGVDYTEIGGFSGSPDGSNVGYSFENDGDTGMFVINDADRAEEGGDLTLVVDGTLAISMLDGSADVGINTAAPQAKLDVNGAIKIGTTGDACSATNSGAIRYNTTDTPNRHEACSPNSSGVHAWRSLTGTIACVSVRRVRGSGITNGASVATGTTYGFECDSTQGYELLSCAMSGEAQGEDHWIVGNECSVSDHDWGDGSPAHLTGKCCRIE